MMVIQTTKDIYGSNRKKTSPTTNIFAIRVQ
jgi:hypothetical protein